MKKLLINEGLSNERIAEEIDVIMELAEEADSVNELLDIESLVGIADYFDSNSWEDIVDMLAMLNSPWRPLYVDLVECWEKLDG